MMEKIAHNYFAKTGQGVGDFDEQKPLEKDVTELMEARKHCLLLGEPFRYEEVHCAMKS